MNARQFFDLVAEMREAQNNYFEARKTSDPVYKKQCLQQSITLERQVDAEIQRVRDILYRQSLIKK